MIKFVKTGVWVIALVVVTAGAAILGEEYVESRRVANNPFTQMDLDSQLPASRLMVYIDPVTRCEYLRPVGSAGTMVARIAGDGRTHYGCGSPIPREVLSRR